MFILSELDEEVDTINILKSYRNLNKNSEEKFIQLVKEYAQPSNFKGTKKEKRDFHNWKNQAQDIFTLLKSTVYFEVDNQGFKLNMGKLGIFTFYKPIRNQTSKAEYFSNHNIEKHNEFDLHHIIPFSKAKNKHEAKLIDDYRNFIYIKKSKHKEFKNHNNDNVIMKMDHSKIDFFDFEGSKIEATNHETALYDSSKKDELNKYNIDLIKKVYTPTDEQIQYIQEIKSRNLTI